MLKPTAQLQRSPLILGICKLHVLGIQMVTSSAFHTSNGHVIDVIVDVNHMLYVTDIAVLFFVVVVVFFFFFSFFFCSV